MNALKNLTAMSARIAVEVPEDLKGTKLGSVVEEAKAKAREETKKLAGDEALMLVTSLEKKKQEKRKLIREMRRNMEVHQKELDDLDRAVAYGEETENYIPLMNLLGHLDWSMQSEMGYQEFEKVRVIPKDWQPKAKA